eukprot:5879792-Lingulodinium_polyedra.AAC.1
MELHPQRRRRGGHAEVQAAWAKGGRAAAQGAGRCAGQPEAAGQPRQRGAAAAARGHRPPGLGRRHAWRDQGALGRGARA